MIAEARPDGDGVAVFENGARAARFPLARRADAPRLSLADFIAPSGASLGLLAVSTGEGIEEQVADFNARGLYLDGYMLQAAAIEAVEALVACVAERLARFWNMPDADGNPSRALAAAFGYPSCPPVTDHKTLFRLLEVEKRRPTTASAPKASALTTIRSIAS